MKNPELKSVYIEPGCVSCGSCEAVCPDVFKIDDVAYVIEGADLKSNSDAIKKSARNCPVNVIKYKEELNTK